MQFQMTLESRIIYFTIIAQAFFKHNLYDVYVLLHFKDSQIREVQVHPILFITKSFAFVYTQTYILIVFHITHRGDHKAPYLTTLIALKSLVTYVLYLLVFQP